MKSNDGLRPLLSKLFCWDSISYRTVDLFNTVITKDFGPFKLGTKFERVNLDLDTRIARLFDSKGQLLGKFKIDFDITEIKSDRGK